MTTSGKEVEVLIQRLTAKARAAGLHMILATQRPSVDVITGVIKSNLPHRVAFQTISKIDSMTILGQSGAEQLLSMGDMLYMEAGKKTVRVHAPFATEKEAVAVADFLRSQAKPKYVEEVTKEQKGDPVMAKLTGKSSGDSDELYEEAIAVIRKHQKVSTSFIQRHLNIGYNKAASLVERMEEEGVVSPATATGKREILM
jgi:S-DNA-T family DNA segregation ATPase FtsK/SpoIIIE